MHYNPKTRVVITGVGLTAPNANNLSDFREALLHQKSGITEMEVRYMGKVAVGNCNFDEFLYQKKKMRRRGTRAGSISIYCAHEALLDSGLSVDSLIKDRTGIYLGITEHGNVETENEIYELHENKLDASLWSHHHNPRTVANAPAGEVSLNLGITGPAYTIGAACAAGNIGIIHGMQMLQLDEVDLALAGGVSESTGTFGIFAGFKSQGALGFHEDPTKASRPLDVNRNGIVVSEGGAIFVLERLEDALKRGAKIYAEIAGYHVNSDAVDFVLPDTQRQIECMKAAIAKAKITPHDIDIVNLHATGTVSGDENESEAVRTVFGQSENTYINCTKGFIGHAMGAAGALELAGNLPSFTDGKIHSCKIIENVDPKCSMKNLVNGDPVEKDVHYILSNSFGMLGINSILIIKKYQQ
ncbi:MAG: beta-ketoacyl-[acyl-carrier-protein] synthase family protein [Smithella sp.]|nr:beta-ketoacyl-[acyl-carrier-protein] synthase family protein [Smithella sp.]MDM7988422.1 beta-ketoacyl-[acyl-carrier-protein] synthase family protein [Smithella sp.]HOU51103.1 beta-ketoacyl-[acyl-carrier-protein] synthase family protein [Smithella sp.]HQG66277.1 beta-ketoacyl-[acyl-carrier-protein] synthase family protein [Smithella sp.]HQH16664.1 beta-ketoacyl-[acyl-carrier-protein] synthase family protein [Smithella sp.]